MQSPRRDRRAGSRRERKRVVEEKADRFIYLHRQGLPKQAIAQTLNLPLRGVNELFELSETYDRGEGGG